MQFLLRLWLMLPSLMICGCTGTFGTMSWRSWNDRGTLITEVRTTGVEVRNLPGFYGVALGRRHTLYGTSSLDSISVAPESLSWKYGWCPAPQGSILILSQRTIGIESSYEPTFVGISVGLSNRTVSVIPVEEDISLVLSINHDHPRESRIKLLEP